MDTRIQTLINAIGSLRELSASIEDMKACKDALNNIFITPKTCKTFIYTVNYDKLPFGCVVMPLLDQDTYRDMIIAGSGVSNIREYEVEIDSKMFDYGLTDEQVATVILYNVSHLLKDEWTIPRVRELIDAHLTNRGSSLVLRDSLEYRTVLMLGISDALNQLTSCLHLDNQVVSDPYLEDLGVAEHLTDALDKLYAEIPGCENEVKRGPKLSMLDWALRVYNKVEFERVPAIYLLKKCRALCASELYNSRMGAAMDAIERIEAPKALTESAIDMYLDKAKHSNSAFGSLLREGFDGFKYDAEALRAGAEQADNEKDVMKNLKDCNVRLSLIQNYIENHPGDVELAKWRELSDNYEDIRDVAAKNPCYLKYDFGIFSGDGDESESIHFDKII